MGILAYAKLNPITNNILAAANQKIAKGLLWYKQKEKTSQEEFLYWYPSLNSGLPIVEKPDKIHQAIYMFHDLVHTCLYDPLPDCDKSTYILGKMVGEAMAQLIADGIFATILQKNYDATYSYHKRYYIQMYELLAPNTDIQKLAVALSYFAIFNDRKKLIALCNNPESKKWTHVYCNLYSKMFNADLWWNNEVYQQFEGNKFVYNHQHCYRNNQKKVFSSIEQIVEHNLKLLAIANIEDDGNEVKLSQQLSPNQPFVYQLVKVNYKKIIAESTLAPIRATL